MKPISNPFGYSMTFLENHLYHIYNRGNNKQKIFYSADNYLYFLRKVEAFIQPYCDILAYCLMPNHFHLMIHADFRTVGFKTVSDENRNVLSEGIRTMLSSFAQGINRQNNFVGSLFQQNTRSKALSEGGESYERTCFNYIHQNPLKANLVGRMEDWPYSSFADYCNFRNDSICNLQLATDLLNLNRETFYEDSYNTIDGEELRGIFKIRGAKMNKESISGFKERESGILVPAYN